MPDYILKSSKYKMTISMRENGDKAKAVLACPGPDPRIDGHSAIAVTNPKPLMQRMLRNKQQVFRNLSNRDRLAALADHHKFRDDELERVFSGLADKYKETREFAAQKEREVLTGKAS